MQVEEKLGILGDDVHGVQSAKAHQAMLGVEALTDGGLLPRAAMAAVGRDSVLLILGGRRSLLDT